MQAIVPILPIALADALSSVPIMASIFILLAPNRSRAALPFLVGWVVGIFVVVLLCTLLAQVVPTTRSPRRPDTVVAALEILLGVAIIGVAAWSWLRSRHQSRPTGANWLKKVDMLGPWSSLGLGLLLNLRPKGLLLAGAAGLSIRADAESTTSALLAVTIYTLIAASTVAAPVIATLAAPARMTPRLVRIKEWMSRHGEAVTSVILALIGAVIVVMGIARW
ncbi:GAP family protein [Diaminobutyricimonas sp. LJ205]|uniref:GAP family protein n=1 Tax=Diaminobutyricimonas sp. LJ205 TaxID=2683590 RepID=UPI0012F49678|nr:GAP family protein [Diaminobutyricimonas sp. LJ205]